MSFQTLLKEKLALEVLQLKVQEKADQLQAEVVHWGIIAKCESSAKERVSFENMKLTYDLNETRVNLAKSEAKRTEVDRKMKKHMDRMVMRLQFSYKTLYECCFCLSGGNA